MGTTMGARRRSARARLVMIDPGYHLAVQEFLDRLWGCLHSCSGLSWALMLRSEELEEVGDV